ncbi:MAG: hypothetical protein ACYCO5_14250, partial [Acidobacteriaceae bacterium]
EQRLSSAASAKTLAVGCPFCKSMLGSTPGKSDADGIAIKDVAELLLESVQKKKGLRVGDVSIDTEMDPGGAAVPLILSRDEATATHAVSQPESSEKVSADAVEPGVTAKSSDGSATPVAPERKKWQPKPKDGSKP